MSPFWSKTTIFSVFWRYFLAIYTVSPYREGAKNSKFSKVAFYGFPYFLLKLAESVDLTVYTPACLPRPEDDFYRQTGNVYGELEKLVKNSTSRFVWARQGKGKSVGKVKDLVKFSSFEDRRWVQDPLGTFGP